MVATAELDACEPMTRSPSWWPGTRRPSTSGGRWPIGTEPTILPRPSAGAADRAARPQAGLQLLAELPAGVEVDRLVDRLVADPHRRVVGELHLQPPAGLLGRVPAVQHALHRGPQDGVPRQFRGLGAALPLPRQPVGPLGLVPAGAGV